MNSTIIVQLGNMCQHHRMFASRTCGAGGVVYLQGETYKAYAFGHRKHLVGSEQVTPYSQIAIRSLFLVLKKFLSGWKILS